MCSSCHYYSTILQVEQLSRAGQAEAQPSNSNPSPEQHAAHTVRSRAFLVSTHTVSTAYHGPRCKHPEGAVEMHRHVPSCRPLLGHQLARCSWLITMLRFTVGPHFSGNQWRFSLCSSPESPPVEVKRSRTGLTNWMTTSMLQRFRDLEPSPCFLPLVSRSD